MSIRVHGQGLHGPGFRNEGVRFADEVRYLLRPQLGESSLVVVLRAKAYAMRNSGLRIKLQRLGFSQ